MAEPDSWEDMDAPPQRPQRFHLNPNASTFSFNPSAVTFTPNVYPPGNYGYVHPQAQVPSYMPANPYYPTVVPPGIQQVPPYPQHGANYRQQDAGYYNQSGGYYPSGNNKQSPIPGPLPNLNQPLGANFSQVQTEKSQPPQTAHQTNLNAQPDSRISKDGSRDLGSVQKVGSSSSDAPTVLNDVKPSAESRTNTEVKDKLSSEPKSDSIPSNDGTSNIEPDSIATEVKDVSSEKKSTVKSKKKESDVASTVEKLSSLDIKQSTEDVSDFKLPEDDPIEEDTDTRDHLNLVFIGHVDAGKSTIGGQILYLSNMVDERTIQKYEKEAKDKNRESWYMAYIMDTNEEERAKGKTVEVGRATFETEKRRYTILDAPGHKNYVPNMISGASQADVGVLVIAARKGEFETGFERGGQTREHAQLAKTLGVSKLVVVINKMDDPSVNWSKERFDEIITKMTPFLRQCGYNTKKDVQFLPISGLNGANMKVKVTSSTCPWWSGLCFFDVLDNLEPPERDPKGPFRMPIIDKYRDMGTVVMGKIESGSVRRGDNLFVMPNKVPVKVITIFRENKEVNVAKVGENLRIRLTGIEEDDISPGFVLSSVEKPIASVLEFDAQLQILELLDHKAIFTAGYKAVLHIHSIVEECEIIELLTQIDPKTKKTMKKKPLFVKNNAVITCRIQVGQIICVEKFEDFPQLGRFTLRDEGKTVAIGKVIKLLTPSATLE